MEVVVGIGDGDDFAEGNGVGIGVNIGVWVGCGVDCGGNCGRLTLPIF